LHQARMRGVSPRTMREKAGKARECRQVRRRPAKLARNLLPSRRVSSGFNQAA
jgi:hypothetical protein